MEGLNEWTEEEVAKWFGTLGKGKFWEHYQQLAREEGIDGCVLSEATTDTLVELGFKKHHAGTIVCKIKKDQASQTSKMETENGDMKEQDDTKPSTETATSPQPLHRRKRRQGSGRRSGSKLPPRKQKHKNAGIHTLQGLKAPAVPDVVQNKGIGAALFTTIAGQFSGFETKTAGMLEKVEQASDDDKESTCGEIDKMCDDMIVKMATRMKSQAEQVKGMVNTDGLSKKQLGDIKNWYGSVWDFFNSLFDGLKKMLNSAWDCIKRGMSFMFTKIKATLKKVGKEVVKIFQRTN